MRKLLDNIVSKRCYLRGEGGERVVREGNEDVNFIMVDHIGRWKASCRPDLLDGTRTSDGLVSGF